jgi:hypothetical protein
MADENNERFVCFFDLLGRRNGDAGKKRRRNGDDGGMGTLDGGMGTLVRK